MGVIELLLVALLVIVVLGVIYVIAAKFFPEPIPLAIVVVLAILVLLAALGSGDLNLEHR